MSKYKHIIWDWNGTLLNDGWLFVDIMNSILEHRNMKTISLKKYREIFEFPVEKYYIKLGFNFQQESFEKCGLEFINKYRKRCYEAKLYPKVITLLKKLTKIGITHSILSAQHQEILNNHIKYYNIKKYFISLIGLDNYFATSKINNGIKFIKQVNINPSNILMIGDTNHDYESSIKMGIDCILLSHGHYSKKRLLKKTTKVLDSLDEIYPLIQNN